MSKVKHCREALCAAIRAAASGATWVEAVLFDPKEPEFFVYADDASAEAFERAGAVVVAITDAIDAAGFGFIDGHFSPRRPTLIEGWDVAYVRDAAR